jgi:hypothetical protein
MILGPRTVISRVHDLDRARAWHREGFEVEPSLAEPFSRRPRTERTPPS